MTGHLPGGRGSPEFVGGTLDPFPTWKPFVVGAHRTLGAETHTFQSEHRVLECDSFTYGRITSSPNARVEPPVSFLFCPADHRWALVESR